MSSERETFKPYEFHNIARKLREFFDKKGFCEAYVQNRRTILSACENHESIATFNIAGEKWPLLQTGQMSLEVELMKDPHYIGLYCFTTSYRDEKEPNPERHDIIFPMFEFETHGTMEEMMVLEKELLLHLGFRPPLFLNDFPDASYEEVAQMYGVEELEHEHETRLGKEFGQVFFLTDFPESTSPFWNMARDPETGLAKKIDVIIGGVEVIGSAQRSSDIEQMRETFYTISDGEYCKKLFEEFGKERVEKELEEFLHLRFIPRCGGGIGLSRLLTKMKEFDLL